MENKSRSMTIDTIVYMIAKIIEGIIGVVTISVYTYCFIPEEFGKYNIVNLTIVTSALIMMDWLSKAIMRYINEYNNNQVKFYSTIFFLWLKITAFIVIILSIGIYIYTLFNNSLKSILWISLIMFITYSTNIIVSNILVVKRKIKLNLILSLSSSILKLASALILVKLFGAKIEWILIPNIVFDFIVIIISIFKLDIINYISYSNYSKSIYNKFIIYGIPIIGLTISTSILYNSDRYIIRFFIDSAAVGIYYANYSLMSSAFSMLSVAIMKGSYPSILKAWSENNKSQTIDLISQAVRYYLLISVPAIIGVAVLAESLAKLILDSQYIEGYTVMKWVALGMTFLGLTEYSNKYWELEVNTKVIFKYSFISGITNIMLNIILVPIIGYKVAAITTAIGFFIYLVLSLNGSRKNFKWTLTKVNYIKIICSAVIMGIVLKIIINILNVSFINFILIVILGIFIYLLCLYVSGEIKGEVLLITNFLKIKFKPKFDRKDKI